MKFTTKTTNDMTADTLICFIYENREEKSQLFSYLDELSQNQLSKQIEFGAISAKFLEISKFAINENLKVVIAGLGKFEELTRKKFYQAVSSAAKFAKNLSLNETIGFEIIDHGIENRSKEFDFQKKEAIELALCAVRGGIYEFDKYITNKKNKIEAIEIIEPEIDEEIEKGAMIGAYSSMAIKFAKDLINDAPQVVTPLYVAQTAESVAKEYGLEWEVFNKDKIKQLNMNAFLAVGQGSVNEPKFVHLCYKPKKEPAKKIALIGKGITFDAGGMDIKPAQSMLTMKSDMSGAASVLGIIQAISKLNSEVEVHAICALCENMTSGSAYKPGDVVVASNGKSIEIENTDAEGRLTLADALCFADSLEVDEVIDIATLTGAVIPALGCNITAILGNNQQQMDTFKHCARKSAENVWQMPILDELKDNLKSDIADFKNTGGRAAGTSTAAWFLSNFTKSNAWMHLDIAGTAYSEKTNKEGAIGATGVMIRSLINYILN